MGLGLYVIGTHRNWMFARRPNRTVLEEIGKYFLSLHARSYQVLVEAYLEQDEDVLWVSLHPAEEWIRFAYEEGRGLTCAARTNSAGPGYHAFLVDALEECGEEAFIKWVWKDHSCDIGDPTGYHQHRDYGRLQTEMLRWLKAVARKLAESSQDSYFRLCLPPGYPPVMDNPRFAMSPMGFWDRQWFEQIAEAPLEQLATYGAQFFAWWNKGQDARFWLNAALCLMWTACPWHRPGSRSESRLHQVTAGCLERAYALDPSLPYPWSEWKEIASYFEDPVRLRQVETRAPASSGPPTIGYKRRMLRQQLIGDWSIVLPGYFYREMRVEPEVVECWFEDCWLKASTLKSQRADGSPVPASEVLPQRGDLGAEVLELEDGPPIGWARIASEEHDGQVYVTLQGYAAVDGDLATVAIGFEKPEYVGWAVATWRSIEHERHDPAGETSGRED